MRIAVMMAAVLGLLILACCGGCAHPLPRSCFGVTLGQSKQQVEARMVAFGWGPREGKPDQPSLGLSRDGGPRPEGFERFSVKFQVAPTRFKGEFQVKDGLDLVFLDDALLAIERSHPDMSNPTCEFLLDPSPLQVPPRAEPWGQVTAKRQAALVSCGRQRYGRPTVIPHYEQVPWAEPEKDGEVVRWSDERTHLAVGWRGTAARAGWRATCVDDRLWRRYRDRVQRSTTIPPCPPGKSTSLYTKRRCWAVDDVVYGF